MYGKIQERSAPFPREQLWNLRGFKIISQSSYTSLQKHIFKPVYLNKCLNPSLRQARRKPSYVCVSKKAPFGGFLSEKDLVLARKRYDFTRKRYRLRSKNTGEYFLNICQTTHRPNWTIPKTDKLDSGRTPLALSGTPVFRCVISKSNAITLQSSRASPISSLASVSEIAVTFWKCDTRRRILSWLLPKVIDFQEPFNLSTRKNHICLNLYLLSISQAIFYPQHFEFTSSEWKSPSRIVFIFHQTSSLYHVSKQWYFLSKAIPISSNTPSAISFLGNIYHLSPQTTSIALDKRKFSPNAAFYIPQNQFGKPHCKTSLSSSKSKQLHWEIIA